MPVPLLFAGGAASGGGPPPEPEPTANWLVWLRADADSLFDAFGDPISDGSAVVTAVDRTGNSRDHTQPVAISRPIWHDDVWNGQGALEFDGVNDYLRFLGLGNVWWGPPITVIVVCDYDVGDRLLWANGNTLSVTAQVKVSAATTQMIAAATFTANIGKGPGSPLLYRFVFDGASSLVDLVSASATGDTGATGGRVQGSWLGANVDLTSFFDGRVAELILYDGIMPSAEWASVRDYLLYRYGAT